MWIILQRFTTDMILSGRQLQEKYKGQNVPLYIAFIDLTKAFDLVSKDVCDIVEDWKSSKGLQHCEVFSHIHKGDYPI